MQDRKMQDLKMEDLLGMRRAYMSDGQRLENGLPIRRPRRKQQLQNDCRLRTCVAKYDNGEYTKMQFLRAVSHSVMHAQPLQIQDDQGRRSPMCR